MEKWWLLKQKKKKEEEEKERKEKKNPKLGQINTMESKRYRLKTNK